MPQYTVDDIPIGFFSKRNDAENYCIENNLDIKKLRGIHNKNSIVILKDRYTDTYTKPVRRTK